MRARRGEGIASARMRRILRVGPGMMRAMILWLNGAFGVGKTTTSRCVAGLSGEWHLFDPEWVGYMLRANLEGVEFNDFQDLAASRRLVPLVAREITLHTGTDLIVCQTVLVEQYWEELLLGLQAQGLEVLHVLLDCNEAVLRSRIASDEDDRDAEEWRTSHLDAYKAARTWMLNAADLAVDTTSADPGDVARLILNAVL
jgi:chloramphenicol 3-O-phosphotransferase